MDFSSDMNNYENLSTKDRCISSLLELYKRDYDVGKFLKKYENSSIKLSEEDSNEILLKIYDKYLNQMYSVDKQLIDVNKLISKLNSYTNKIKTINNAWNNYIVKNNRKYDINLPIRFPEYPKAIILDFCSKKFNKIFKDIKELADQFSDNSLYMNLTQTVNTKYLDAIDCIHSEYIEEEYVDKFPAQGLFLIKNPDFLNLIDKSKKNLTFGLFMLRIVSSINQITFESDKLTTEMKVVINKKLQSLLAENENKKSIIVSLSLSDPPYCFKKFFTSLLHDSIVQAATYSNDSEYVIKINKFFKQYLDNCLKLCKPLTEEKWNSFIQNQSSLLLNPVGFFMNYANSEIEKLKETIKQKEYKIQSLLSDLETAVMYKDPITFLRTNYSAINYYEIYSSCMWSILDKITEFDWYEDPTEITEFFDASKLYEFLK
ncbi:nuclear chaperone required for maturation and nuclear export of pre-60s ribosome subunits [Trichomonas vaginalis G3]|uniref:nuclear chaperone required for maturation and nuclear export of pre-60s ribosome subunits n=1 Tax=Trichomonas vaginalis (strain ATCC PRA-98 / G3) TaxID=412133 RepID=UPI0021E58455|nr:nuclear chaperone required for maturation and nuclear export of pre-60s ribosome subunits [Trichomonas vaginalis G3]KAI5492822.1 nuclear chaperone required for maturation and nuclear export of pre-60s ribosome subunits [Trichomonas vaginalis G3]